MSKKVFIGVGHGGTDSGRLHSGQYCRNGSDCKIRCSGTLHFCNISRYGGGYEFKGG